MLHIHNGDCSADIARESSLAGEHLVWRESLLTGPSPAGLSDSAWRRVRAQHLSTAYGQELQDCERELLGQDEALAAFSEHEEVVLWFEHDLFCQLHLIYLLNWFSRRKLGKTRLSLICIGEFAGKENFRGLGELNPKQLASLFPERQKVTKPQLELAKLAWRAYCSPNPKDIEKILQADTSTLPFVDPALRAHLRRFPSTSNGLGSVENHALQFVHSGVSRFSELFSRVGDAEPFYGFGDAQFWLALQRMSTAGQPLLTIAGLETSEAVDRALTPETVQNASFEINDLGETVLKDEADFVALNGIDLWLGGAYLHGSEGFWRWDQLSERLVFDQNS